jgi:hypothetical protein
MLAEEGKRLVANYLNWLKEGFSLNEGGGHLSITTPFLDPHNDEIEIFVEKEGDNIKLSDDGYTISDLKANGLEINTAKRELHVKQIANGFGVKWEADGQLSVITTPKDFPQKKHNLIQAILAIHDLMVMGQTHVAQFFEEDVRAFLDDKNIPYVTDVKLSGRSGFDHRFSFVLPKTKARPQAILHVINTLTRDLATSVAFAVHDVRIQRENGDLTAFTIINDRDTRPSDDHIDALRAYNVTPIKWSDREILASALSLN